MLERGKPWRLLGIEILIKLRLQWEIEHSKRKEFFLPKITMAKKLPIGILLAASPTIIISFVFMIYILAAF